MKILERFLLMLEGEKWLKEGTIKGYKSDVELFLSFVDKELEDIATDDVRGYLVKLKRDGLSLPTINRKVIIIRSFFNYLRREGLIEANPFEGIKLGKVPKPKPKSLTREEVISLIEATDDPKYRLIFLILYQSGLRVSEVLSLKVGDINVDLGRFSIVGKGGKERYCFLSSETLGEYLDYLREKELKEGDILFPSSQRGKDLLSARTVQRKIKDYAQKAGIKKRIHPHLLRHSCAKHLLDDGVGLTYVKAYLGHEDIKTTEIYTTPDESSLERMYRQHEGALMVSSGSLKGEKIAWMKDYKRKVRSALQR